MARMRSTADNSRRPRAQPTQRATLGSSVFASGSIYGRTRSHFEMRLKSR